MLSRNNSFTEMPIARIRAKFLALKPALDERLARLWAGAEAEALGEGGVTIVARATGMSRTTVRAGRDELRKGIASGNVVRVRRPGAGRRSLEEKIPGIVDVLEGLIEPTARGGRPSPLRWTLKSTRKLSVELRQRGISISPQKVGQLLHARGYHLRGGIGRMVTAPPAVRHRQFELINLRVEAFQECHVPVISIDTRYTVLAGDAAHGGHDQQPDNERVAGRGGSWRGGSAGTPRARDMAELARRFGPTHDDIDRETSIFTVRAIAAWWRHAHLDSKELLVTVDGIGESSGARHWRSELQRFADGSGLSVGVSHFPPGTSKWNHIGHHQLYLVTESWRDHPRVDREVAISQIGNVRTTHHGTTPASLGSRASKSGSPHDRWYLLPALDAPHDEWNYTLHPQ